MTSQEKIDLIQELRETIEQLDEARDDLDRVVGGNPEGQIYQAIARAVDLAIDCVAVAVGDTKEDGWLDWFVYDNSWGEKGYEAGLIGDLRPVRTIADIVDLIEKSKGEG
jgi:hypothetical protein